MSKQNIIFSSMKAEKTKLLNLDFFIYLSRGLTMSSKTHWLFRIWLCSKVNAAVVVFKLKYERPKNMSRPRLYPLFYGTSMKLLFKYLCRPKIAFGNPDHCKAVLIEEWRQVKRRDLRCSAVILNPVVLVKSLSLSVPQFPHWGRMEDMPSILQGHGEVYKYWMQSSEHTSGTWGKV